MTCPSDDQLRRWIQSLGEGAGFPSDKKIKHKPSVKLATRIVKIAKDEAIAKYEKQKAQRLATSAAYEIAKRDVADVLRRYTPAEPVTGYINVFGWYAP